MKKKFCNFFRLPNTNSYSYTIFVILLTILFFIIKIKNMLWNTIGLVRIMFNFKHHLNNEINT